MSCASHAGAIRATGFEPAREHCSTASNRWSCLITAQDAVDNWWAAEGFEPSGEPLRCCPPHHASRPIDQGQCGRVPPWHGSPPPSRIAAPLANLARVCGDSSGSLPFPTTIRRRQQTRSQHRGPAVDTSAEPRAGDCGWRSVASLRSAGGQFPEPRLSRLHCP